MTAKSVLVRRQGLRPRARAPTCPPPCYATVWALAQSRGDGHRSLVTSESIFSECNEDLFFFDLLRIEQI